MRHTDRAYEAELRQLEEQLLTMAGQVESMIQKSVQSLLDRDPELARRVITSDQEVNRAERAIDELCLVMLAKRQPMASDLRFISLALKMVTDLERIGDLAVNISERSLKLLASPPLSVYDQIGPMTDIVQSMVRDAIEAFIARDGAAAEEVIIRDDEVDERYHSITRQVLAVMNKQPELIEIGIHVQSVCKFLERIADHSTNLAEFVIYMAQGKDVRHPGKR